MPQAKSNQELLEIIKNATDHRHIEGIKQSILGYISAHYPRTKLGIDLAEQFSHKFELLPDAIMQEVGRHKATQALEADLGPINIGGGLVGRRISYGKPTLAQIQEQVAKLDRVQYEAIAKKQAETMVAK